MSSHSPDSAERAAAGASTTVRGAAIRETLAREGGFRSAQAIYAAMRAEGSKIGLSTVYRHLQSFADQGWADVIHTADGEMTFRMCGQTVRKSHHHHLVCRRCGRAEEVEGRSVERWATSVASAHGFVDIDHTVEIFGTCATCASVPG